MDLRNVTRSGLAATLLLSGGCYVDVGGSLSAGSGAATAGNEAPPPQVVQTSGNPPPPTVHATGNPPPPTVYASGSPPPAPQAGTPTVFGSTGSFSGSVQGNVYFLPTGTGSLPDFSRLQPVTTLYTDRWDVAARRFDTGFPGIPDRYEWFAIRYAGNFQVAAGGTYAFELLSDDGAKLFVDGRLVVDNDGTHPPQSRSGAVTLTPGVHAIEVQYFQGPAYEIALQLFVTPPGGSRQIFVTHP